MPSTEKVKVNIHEKDFEIEIFEKQGRVFAKTHVNDFGEIVVPDFGGGKERPEDPLGSIRRSMSL